MVSLNGEFVLMIDYETWHWRTFNVSARLFGLVALLVGVGFVVSGEFLVGPFALALAGAFLRVRPYRPDLGDSSYLFDPFGSRGNSQAARRWWTGDEAGGG